MMRRAVVIATMVAFGCTPRERAGSQGDAGLTVAVAPSPSSSSSSSSRVPLLDAASVAFDLPPPPAPVVVTPPGAWEWKTHRGDRFSIAFPGEPKVTVLPPEDDKAGYTEASLTMPGGQVSFAAGFTEHTEAEVAKPEAFLDERMNAPRRGQTDVLHRRAMTLPGGQPGRVLILRRNISGTPLRVYSRLYLVGRRLYSLIVSTLDVGGVGEEVVKRFMESWRLL